MMAYRTTVPSPNQYEYNHRGSKIKSRREFLWGRREKENTTGDFISALLLTAVMYAIQCCMFSNKKERERGGKGLAQLIFQEYNKQQKITKSFGLI